MPDPVHPAERRARRRLPALVLAATAALAVLGGLIPQLPGPSGAPAGAAPVPAGSPGVLHYFGRGAYDGVRRAVAATPRACAISDDDLAAMVMAPIFKEVSPGLTPPTAPSPMTLSRWDEWTGVTSGSNNTNANYGLYAFRDAYGTPYPRAYWTPGVGAFQYDSAGVGAPFTASELMDVGFIARPVATGMAARYCAAGGSGPAARAAAWQPWSALGGVPKSERFYEDMMAPGLPPFARIGLVKSIEEGGGMRARTCVVAKHEVPCQFIDPAKAQGANWWALDDPTGGARARGEAPLPAPFYVVKRNGYEERHWLARDTGYPINITARRLLGQNARPRDGQPRSGLQWLGASDLCDTARPEMGCASKRRPAAAKRPKQPAKRRGPASVSELLRPLRPEGDLLGEAKPKHKATSALPPPQSARDRKGELTVAEVDALFIAARHRP